jgi:predicted transcriptional regulator
MAETPIRHVRIADETWDALGRIGEELERTPGWLTRKAVEEYIERHRAAKRAAKEASVDKPQPR